jgi:beta-N-acetylhexosaminidase
MSRLSSWSPIFSAKGDSVTKSTGTLNEDPHAARIDEEVPLDQKIGQMLIAGFRGVDIASTGQFKEHIRSCHLGGIILYDRDVMTGSDKRNVESPAQVKKLVSDLQHEARSPLLVTIDQEGGMVDRLSAQRGFASSVSASYLGKCDDVSNTREHSCIIADTLSNIGVNLNLAPVVDLNINRLNPIIGQRERSFSPDPKKVIIHASAFIEGHRQKGVLCCLKHFPGHGSSTTDSHLGFTDVSETWSEIELLPFQHLIQNGLADTVMISHVFLDRLDSQFPATLSAPIIKDTLRGQLKFDGVVISDDLQMGAITQHYGFETALRKAINAGTDLITLGNNQTFEEDLIPRAFETVKMMVQNGDIPAERIDASYARIIRLKALINSMSGHRRP